MLAGGLTWSNVRRTLPTVWCIRSHMALACGFLLVVGTSLILVFSRSRWNANPVNSPPLSWIHRCGQGYQANQLWAKRRDTCSAVLLSTRTISTSAVTVSIDVRALNL